MQEQPMRRSHPRFAWVLRPFWVSMGVAAWVLGVVACEGRDNPAALSSLDPQVGFDIHATELETLEEVEVHAAVMESGSPMDLRTAILEITPESGVTRALAMTREGDEYAVHVTFYQPGEHHLHLMGIPRLHHLEIELGEIEVDVARHHTIIGPYWVELETAPAPVGPGQAGHLHLFTYLHQPDGSKGPSASGLTVGMAVHDLAGVESDLAVTEESPGTFEAEYDFGNAGEYELHVSIDVAGVEEEGEFHIPVVSPDSDDGGDDNGGGGHGH